MTFEESRLEILRRVGNGTLTVEEGSDLIGILDHSDVRTAREEEESIPDDGVYSDDVIAPPQVSNWWKALWSLILLGGATLTGFSAYWAYQGFQKAGLGWGFWLSWIPFLLGVVIMVLGGVLLDSPWLYLKVVTRDEGKPIKIAFAIPLPIKLASWIFTTFHSHLPANMQEMNLNDLLIEVENALKRGEPFQVVVDDEDDDEKVIILIAR
ncbi:MAG: hypothetical protein KBG10_09430 [Anaerolineaceae bacterium]|nr:hypothetical protein [Anaerolineaceae bacterium]